MYNLYKVGVYMEYEVRTVVKEDDLDKVITFFEDKATKKDFENKLYIIITQKVI